jgi:hypothetical protein
LTCWPPGPLERLASSTISLPGIRFPPERGRSASRPFPPRPTIFLLQIALGRRVRPHRIGLQPRASLVDSSIGAAHGFGPPARFCTTGREARLCESVHHSKFRRTRCAHPARPRTRRVFRPALGAGDARRRMHHGLPAPRTARGRAHRDRFGEETPRIGHAQSGPMATHDRCYR